MSIPVKKSLEEVRSDLFARISSVQADGWLPENLNLNRGPVRGMIELWAWGLFQLYQLLGLILKQAFPSMATGCWLDLHCDQVGVQRLPAGKCRGMVYFTRSDSSGNVPIPAGRVVKTLPDGTGRIHRFVTLADTVLLDGVSEVAVLVESEQHGQAGNVTAGAIREITTVIPGIDGVENRSGWIESEGIDTEGDEPLRERYALAWMATGGATKYAYESWARSVTGVVAVKIGDQHPRGQGTVDVVIRGSAGIPSEELLSTVAGVIEKNAPINDDALVKGPVLVPVNIDLELLLIVGEGSTIRMEAGSRLRALFAGFVTIPGIVPLGIGEDLTLDRMIAVIMAVNGVKRVEWRSPTTDIAVPGDGLATLTTLSISSRAAGEA
ncbi:MAG: baseplate J/gp47 family protein [Magnetococcales bacterium]|nr:baseplate J/gp47 family protein [Magnetococcales bacterium]